jgi:hypothetical protein
MKTLNINLKIEAKNIIGAKGINFLKKQGISLNDIYKSFNKDLFLLPYKVQKLSKKARK